MVGCTTTSSSKWPIAQALVMPSIAMAAEIYSKFGLNYLITVVRSNCDPFDTTSTAIATVIAIVAAESGKHESHRNSKRVAPSLYVSPPSHNA